MQRFLWLGLVGLFVATSTIADDQTPVPIEPPEKRIAEIEASLGGRPGVAALDTGSGRRIASVARIVAERFGT